ncbi:MAG: hypothetical protein U0892_21285 [Pirellulales bacterium]
MFLSVWLAKFAYQWLVTRPYGSLLPSLPAIIGFTMVIAAISLQANSGVSWRRVQYSRQLAAAVQLQDFKLAAVCIRTLISMDPQNSDYRIQQAEIEFRRGNENLAVELMSRLVNSQRNGVAAMWLLSKRFDVNKFDEWNADNHSKFRGLISIALAGLKGRDLATAKKLMAGYLSRAGAMSEAAGYLASITTEEPETNLAVAILYKQVGQPDLAAKHAELARNFYAQKSMISPNDVSTRIDLARALVLLKRESEAVQCLLDGFVGTSEPKLKYVAAEALLAQVERIRSEQPGRKSLLQRLEWTQQASNLAANHPQVIEATIQLILECKSNKDDELETLRLGLLRGLDPKSTHFIQGTLALMDGKVNEAKTHLELAANGNAKMPGMLNNLAVALAQRDDRDLEQALKLSDAAVEILPDHPSIRETRGQILFRLKRYKEAITDLEYGLKDETLLPAVVPSLAKAYRALGVSDLAERYEAAEKRLQERNRE